MNTIYNFIFLSLPIFICGIIFINIKIKENRLKLILSFSASYLLSISFLHLLPELFLNGKSASTGVYILLGFFLQLFIEYFSRGIEHGHFHIHKNEHDTNHKSVPLGIVFGLFLHSFLEGIPVNDFFKGTDTMNILSMKNSLIAGITLHNIPIAIAFSGMLMQMKVSIKSIVLYLIAFSLMPFLGSLVGLLIPQQAGSGFSNLNNIFLSIVVGIFLHISTTIMFESSENHKYNIAKMFSIFLGFIMAYFLC